MTHLPQRHRLVNALLAGIAALGLVPAATTCAADLADTTAITVIEREQLLRSGAASLADYLRALPFNSFGSFRPQSLSSAQSLAELSLRGLGGGHTLILIDGRRAPIAPSAGFAQDLNAIPLAAVERIEISRDGSAIYGSSAVGGVVNIVTRQHLAGVELSVGASNPTRAGGETEEGSVLFGMSGDRGRVTAGAAFNNRGIVWQRDRPWAVAGRSTFSNNLLNSFPSPGTPYGFSPGTLTSHPINGSALPGANACSHPGLSLSGTGTARRCYYDFNSVTANDAELRNSALFARASYDINEDWSSYLNASVSRVESFGRYAPVPSSPWPGGAPFVPVGSPNHPASRFPNQGYNADRPYFLRHRFAANGPRDITTDTNNYDVESGFSGNLGGIAVSTGARFLESELVELGRNQIVAPIAQQFIADGTYDIYNPSANPRSVLDAMSATISRDARYRAKELYVSASMEVFELRGRGVELRIGAEYRDESLADRFDTLVTSGQVVGYSDQNLLASRSVAAVHAQLRLPVHDRLDIDLSARHDRYSDVGSESSAQIDWRFKPMDDLVLRASVGEGMHAPTLDVQGIEPVLSIDSISVRPPPQFCYPIPDGCSSTYQVYAYVIANPNLRAENSRQWSLGFDWTPTAWLDLSLSYYDIEINDRIRPISSQQIVNCVLGSATNCPSGLSVLPPTPLVVMPGLGLGLGVLPDSQYPQVTHVQRGFVNLGRIDVSGADLLMRTHFDFADLGQLSNRLTLSWIHSHETDAVEAVGAPAKPRYRAQLDHEWTHGDFSLTWNIQYIHGTQSTADTFGDTDHPARLSSWTTHALQASWHAPWNAELTLGVNNVTDKDPVLDPYDPTGRGYDFALYDGYGRVPYFRYRQTF